MPNRKNLSGAGRTLEETVDTLASLIEKRDPSTAGHQQRVAQLACAIARKLELPKEQIEGTRVAGILHGIGKISEEFSLVKTHPRVGYDVIKGIEFPWSVAQAILQHHERLDGSGYPAGLSGEEIILEARILGVADVLEAMSSHRSSLGIDAASGEISQNRVSFMILR